MEHPDTESERELEHSGDELEKRLERLDDHIDDAKEELDDRKRTRRAPAKPLRADMERRSSS